LLAQSVVTRAAFVGIFSTLTSGSRREKKNANSRDYVSQAAPFYTDSADVRAQRLSPYNTLSLMDTSQLKRMKRHRGLYRFMGFTWVLVGSLLLVGFLPLVFDASSTIEYNGVLTTDIGPKISAAVFSAAFVAAGLAFLLVPARMLDRLFLWRQSAWSSIAFWRR
jgi:hypothetical protein